MPQAGILKINFAVRLLQKELTENFSNCNDSGSESCQDSKVPSTKFALGQIVTCTLTTLLSLRFLSSFTFSVVLNVICMSISFGN